MNTTPNVGLDVFYGNEKYSVSTKQNHIPEGYVTPKVSYEIDLLKDKIGTVSLIGDASLYEVKPIGIKASF